ncbi:MAG: PAS domain-containing protein [Verrucomicrobiales bacterium]|nr:PAS domain-containing protein [Verrucomicrobiales bacterium]
MDSSIHHLPAEKTSPAGNRCPRPGKAPAAWKDAFARAMGEDAVAKWGKQLLRITNDMVVICDEELNIVYHNRGFIRGIGHQQGSYESHHFLNFFPAADRADALKALQGLFRSQQGGLRFGATLLTTRGERPFDARVVRSRRANGQFLLYLVIREEVRRTVDVKKTERQASELLFAGLPVAAFRTDKQLRIIRAFGTLWDDLKVETSTIKGADLVNPQCHLVPPFLRQIDYCDTMAGLTLHADLSWRQEPYEITVEPFLDKNRKVIGTIGMLRKAKVDPVSRGTAHLSIPTPVDPTTPLKQSRTVELAPVAVVLNQDEVSQIRSEIKPRRLASPDIAGLVPQKTDRVALAN